MIVCANHNQTQSTAFCRTCGKPLCDECKRDVRGVIYCEECIAARLAGTLPHTGAAPGAAVVAPPPGLPNPTLAAFLGVIPGVGAFYNGQYVKGLIHILMLPMIIALANMEEMFALLFMAYFPYMIVDAYQTAKAKVLGQTPKDMLGLNSLFGDDSAKVNSTLATGEFGTPATTAANRPPIGAILLIGLGTLFLISNMGVLPDRFLRGWWAMALIGVGVYQAIKVMSVRTQQQEDKDSY